MGLMKKYRDDLEDRRSKFGGDMIARHEMNDADLQDAWTQAQEQMVENLPPEVECCLQDLMLPKEQAIYKLHSSYRSGPKDYANQLVLTNRCLYIFGVGVFGSISPGHIFVRIYPIKDIMAFGFKPMKDFVFGYFQILSPATSENDNESKFHIYTKLDYFKSILLYRKLVKLQSGIE